MNRPENAGDCPLSRRTVLKMAGGSMGALLLAGCGRHGDPYALARPAVPLDKSWGKGEEKFVATACAQCPAGCGIRVRVVEGRAVKIEGHPACPINRGGIGPRGLAGLQTLYDPDRIRRPMKRTGPKGARATWEAITWDEAVRTLGNRLKQLRAREQAHRVAVVCGRERGLMLDLWRRFARGYGTPNLFDGASTGHGEIMTALSLMQGIREMPAYDWPNTRYILSLGSGILESSCQHIYFSRARAHFHRGLHGIRPKIVHVGSCLSRTAMNADEWIAIPPGTQASFVLAVAHVIVREGWHDRDFVENRTFGFRAWRDDEGRLHKGFRDVLMECPPDKMSAVCGIAADVIERIAKEIAQERPAFAITDNQETLASNALASAMAVHALNALLGAIDRAGGVLTQRSTPLRAWPAVALDAIAEKCLTIERLDAASDPYAVLESPRMDLLPEAILQKKRYALDTLLLYYGNPLYARIHASGWRQALRKVPCVVSFSPFMDETTLETADLILPDHTYLERWEDAASSPSTGYPVFGIRQPVVAPLHDTRNTGDVVIALAKAVGGATADAFPWKSFKSALLKRLIGIHKSKSGSIVAKKGSLFLKTLYEDGYWEDPSYPYESWPDIFKTPSGKFEFFSQALYRRLSDIAGARALTVEQLLASWGGDVHPDTLCLPHDAPVTWLGDPRKYPLRLLPFRPNTYAEGSGANLPWLQELVKYAGRPAWETEAEIHPDTARLYGIRDGDSVQVRSPFGAVSVPVHLNAGIYPGVCRIPQGGGHTAYGRWAHGWGANVMRLLGRIPFGPLSVRFPMIGTRVAVQKL